MIWLKLLEELAELRERSLLSTTQVFAPNVVLPVVETVLVVAIGVEVQILCVHSVKIDILINDRTRRHKTRWKLILDFNTSIFGL